MLKNVSRRQLVAAWFALVVVLFAVSVVWGAETSVSSAVLWLLACLAPPAVMLLVWRAPTQTVAELLYDANHPSKEGRR
jgi:quinol-cytochrome oxidoreductase complex cytochrome b subunit